MLLSARSKGADAAKVLAQDMHITAEARANARLQDLPEDRDTLEDLIAWEARMAALEEEALEARIESQLRCPVCRTTGRWRRSNRDELQLWTDSECPVCMQPAWRGVLNPCLHPLCQVCSEHTRLVYAHYA